MPIAPAAWAVAKYGPMAYTYGSKAVNFLGKARRGLNTVKKYAKTAGDVYQEGRGLYNDAMDLRQGVSDVIGSSRRRARVRSPALFRTPVSSARRRLNNPIPTPPRRAAVAAAKFGSRKYAADATTKDNYTVQWKIPKALTMAKIVSGTCTTKDNGEFFLHCRIGRERWFNNFTFLNDQEIRDLMTRSTVRWNESTNEYGTTGEPFNATHGLGFMNRKFIFESQSINYTIKNQSSAAAYLTYWIVTNQNNTKNAAMSISSGTPLENIVNDYLDVHQSTTIANPTDVTTTEMDSIVDSMKMNGKHFKENWKIVHKHTIRLNEGQTHFFNIKQNLNMIYNAQSERDWIKGVTKQVIWKIRGSIGDTELNFPTVVPGDQLAPTGIITTGRAKLIVTWKKTTKCRQIMSTPSISFSPDTALTVSTVEAPIVHLYEKDPRDGDNDDMVNDAS